MVVYGLLQIYIEGTMTKSLKKENLFTNQKEIDQALKAAVDQYEIYSSNTPVKHKRGRKIRDQNQRTRLWSAC